MKVLFPKLVFLVIYLSISASVSHAQKTVLVNGEASKVTVSNTDVTAVNESVPGYMNGYERPTGDIFQKVAPRLGTTTRTSTLPPATVKKEPLLANVKSVSFKEGSFDVNDSGQQFLDIVANTIKSGEAKTILLKTWYKSEDKVDISLTRKRLDACKRYLESKGVVSNLILTSMVAKDKKSTDIAVLMK